MRGSRMSRNSVHRGECGGAGGAGQVVLFIKDGIKLVSSHCTGVVFLAELCLSAG